jgi:8-oxo-dGTP diphosphatase
VVTVTWALQPGADDLVRAAGGVVWRATGTGRPEVALVFRPRYRDWSLPKGKLEYGEPALLAAVREVREETGIEAVPQLRLPSIEYLTGVPGVRKSVDFWSMRVVADHGREPDDEVTEARWVPLGRAPGLLSYAHDRGVLTAFSTLPPVTGELLLVRHAHAGSRRTWHGPDQLRPLDAVGYRQAAALAELLAVFRPVRTVSASPVRCRETVAPLDLPVKIDPAFDEVSPQGIAGAQAALRALTREPGVTVTCSQGKVIPPLLAQLRPPLGATAEPYRTPKGTGWLLALNGDDVVGADRLSP